MDARQKLLNLLDEVWKTAFDVEDLERALGIEARNRSVQASETAVLWAIAPNMGGEGFVLFRFAEWRAITKKGRRIKTVAWATGNPQEVALSDEGYSDLKEALEHVKTYLKSRIRDLKAWQAESIA